MPYITRQARAEILSGARDFKTVGELNFLVTACAHFYVKQHGLNYQTLNDVVGALESAKAEFQRRVVAPFEDAKIAENGDFLPTVLV